jgi:tetratricopeptide (TPR) repeat protein
MTMPEATDLLDLALLAERSGRFDDARDLLRRAILLFGESPESLDARLRLGKLLTLGNPSHHAEAEAVLAEARAQAEPEGATGQASSAIHMLALLERHRRQPDRAERLLEESPVASHSAYPSPARAQWLQYKGLIESDRGNFNAAERYFFRAHQVYREVRDDLGLAEVCDSLANLLLRRGKSRHARIFALASLEQKHKLGDRYGEAITLGTLGRVALLQANYEDAADYFARDLAIALELGDTRGQGIMLNSLGEVALLRNQIEVADNYFRQVAPSRRTTRRGRPGPRGTGGAPRTAPALARAASCPSRPSRRDRDSPRGVRRGRAFARTSHRCVPPGRRRARHDSLAL